MANTKQRRDRLPFPPGVYTRQCGGCGQRKPLKGGKVLRMGEASDFRCADCWREFWRAGGGAGMNHQGTKNTKGHEV